MRTNELNGICFQASTVTDNLPLTFALPKSTQVTHGLPGALGLEGDHLICYCVHHVVLVGDEKDSHPARRYLL